MKYITTRIPGWDALNRIREAPFIRSMYVWIFIVPVLAKSFQKVNEIVWINIFDYEFQIHLSLPFSWQVFFWCAVSFGLANVLTLVFAPRIIKENKNSSDFRSAGKAEGHLKAYADEQRTTFPSIEDFRGFGMKIQDQRVAYESDLHDYFWKLYNHAVFLRSRVRYVCGICYALGFLLLTWLLISNIFWVLRFLFS